MSDSKILETFPNPAPSRDYIIEHTHHEFTSVCPMTGHPDFATITVRYVADKICVELKSLKYYVLSYRNVGIYQEHATARLAQDLFKALGPKRLSIRTIYNMRGGFDTTCTVSLPG